MPESELVMPIVYGLMVLAGMYGLTTLLLSYVVQQFPRNPVEDPPDWGRVEDVRLEAADGGSIETWRVRPEGPSCGTIVFMHGWGRNRDRMVGRARIFAGWGFTTVMHSARDHGHSSSCRMMNIMKFAEDIETVLNWLGEPVLLYGHSAGSGGALIAAARNPDKVRLLFLEGVFADTHDALMHLYKWFNPYFGRFFGPAILFWMNLFYRGGVRRVNPCRLAAEIKAPVMLVHGEKDRRFPLRFAHTLKACFQSAPVTLYVAPGADHSSSSLTPGYTPAVEAFIHQHRHLLPRGQAAGYDN
jgi:pimeloyl-ACP methyl ester carboxylesterase